MVLIYKKNINPSNRNDIKIIFNFYFATTKIKLNNNVGRQIIQNTEVKAIGAIINQFGVQRGA